MEETKSMEQKAALVTGAGTGLGFATAKILSENGWLLFGTIIPSQSPDELQALGITPIVMDITNKESVEDGYRFIASQVGDRGLGALVNVAGVAGIVGGVIEGVSEERIQALFDVNVFGTIRVIQVFLPLLRKYGPARIVNVSSSGVRVPSAFSGIYAISKYAVEGITNSLRYEMPIFGIQVTSIEPGAMDTPMTANSKENMAKTWDTMPEEVRALYYEKLNPSLEYMDNMIQQANPPEVVAEVVLKALKAKTMRIRYVGGKDVRFMPFLQRVLGENLFEKLMITIQKLPKPDWA
jgi:NAD(P)-dependent dehydrogenase (short-subunit alcohol dehydrogenase family)